jgi:GntR family transcriptional regulator
MKSKGVAMDRKYNQVKQYILEIILKMKVGEKLPSERDLIEELGFSRATVQRAILDLEKEVICIRSTARAPLSRTGSSINP